MSERAQIHDASALSDFRNALIKFAEAAKLVIIDADSDVSRTIQWIDLEQIPYWTAQIRKREEQVTRAKDAVRQKQLFKDALGRTQSAVDELKQLKKAQQSLAEANQKLQVCRTLLRRLLAQQMEYKGQIQKLQLALTSTVPEAIAELTNIVRIVERYSTPAAGEAKSVAQSPTDASKSESSDEEPSNGTV